MAIFNSYVSYYQRVIQGDFAAPYFLNDVC